MLQDTINGTCMDASAYNLSYAHCYAGSSFPTWTGVDPFGVPVVLQGDLATPATLNTPKGLFCACSATLIDAYVLPYLLWCDPRERGRDPGPPRGAPRRAACPARSAAHPEGARTRPPAAPRGCSTVSRSVATRRAKWTPVAVALFFLLVFVAGIHQLCQRGCCGGKGRQPLDRGERGLQPDSIQMTYPEERGGVASKKGKKGARDMGYIARP